MMKALAAMRGPLSFTAVELCKCQHQTVVDLVDLAGTESLAVLALRAVQVVPDPEFRAGKTMIGQPARVVTTIAPLVRVVMMTVRVSVGMMRVRLVRVVMMIVRDSVGMMRVRLVRVVMMIVRLVHLVRGLQHSRRPMKFVTVAAVGA
jgi:hypothetical protein